MIAFHIHTFAKCTIWLFCVRANLWWVAGWWVCYEREHVLFDVIFSVLPPPPSIYPFYQQTSRRCLDRVEGKLKAGPNQNIDHRWIGGFSEQFSWSLALRLATENARYYEPFLLRKIMTGHLVESEVWLCIDHSGGSRDRKWGCLFRDRLWAVVLRLAEFWWTGHPLFPVAQQRESVKDILLLLLLSQEMVKWRDRQQHWCAWYDWHILIGVRDYSAILLSAWQTHIQTSLSVSVTVVTSLQYS